MIQDKTLTRRSLIGGAAMFGLALVAGPTSAFADEESDAQAKTEEEAELEAAKQKQYDEVYEKLVNLQVELEESSEIYFAALAAEASARAAMERAQQEIDEVSAKVDSLKARLGNRAAFMYKTGPTGFLDFLLNTASFQEFSNNWDLLNGMNASDVELLHETQDSRAQLEAAYEEYALQQQTANEQAEAAVATRSSAEASMQAARDSADLLDDATLQLIEMEAASKAAELAGANHVPVYRSSGDPEDHSEVVNYARMKLGCPYEWAAAGPDSFDCSGLVVWAYAQIGITLPHYTESLYAAAKNVIPVEQAKPGDVLYRYGHVGIAEAEGGVPYVHAPTFNAYVRDTDSLSWAGFTCALQF